MRRLTDTPNLSEYGADWDPSGERLAFARFPAQPDGQVTRVAIAEINADGSCDRRILLRREGTLSPPVWRPGPGRGAGRIECG